MTKGVPVTVKEFITELEKLDPNLPVMVSTYYDNDIGHATEIEIREGFVENVEDFFWTEVDASDPANITLGTIPAIIITANGANW